jgi:hypothetical protein
MPRSRNRCRDCGSLMYPMHLRGAIDRHQGYPRHYCRACLYAAIQFCYQLKTRHIFDSWLRLLQARRARSDRHSRGG